MGFASAPYEVEAGDPIRGQKSLVGSFAYSAEQFGVAIELPRRTKSEWVTNLSLDEVEPQLHAFAAGDFAMVKAVLRPPRS